MEINVNDSNFEQEVLKSETPVLVDFWAPWCGPCQMVAPIVKAIAEKYKGKLKVCKINVDESPVASAEHDIVSIPMLAILKNGSMVDKVVGAILESELASKIETHI